MMKHKTDLQDDTSAPRKIVFPVKLGVESMQRLLTANSVDDVEYDMIRKVKIEDLPDILSFYGIAYKLLRRLL